MLNKLKYYLDVVKRFIKYRRGTTALPELRYENGLSLFSNIKNIYIKINFYRWNIIKYIINTKLALKIMEYIEIIIFIILLLNVLLLHYVSTDYIIIILFFIWSIIILFIITIISKRKEEKYIYINIFLIYINISNLLFFFYEYILVIVDFIIMRIL